MFGIRERSLFAPVMLALLLGAAPGALAHGPGSAPGQSGSHAARARGEKLTTDLVDLTVQHQAAASGHKSSLEQSLISAARTRKQELLGLMATDPGEVLRLAVPATIRGRMPASVQAHVEQDADIDGEIEVLHEDNPSGDRYHYTLQTAHGRVSMHFAGDEPDHIPSGSHVRVKGVQLDQMLALGGSGSIQLVTSALVNTFGAQKTLVILVNFSDLTTTTDSLDHIKTGGFAATSNFFLSNSYGKTWLTGDVVGWFTIAMSSTVCDYNTLASLAIQKATAAGVNVSSYPRLVFNFPANACTWLGLGTVGGNPSKAWIKGGFSIGTVAHEMGHNLGLYHSHSLDCGAAVMGGACTTGEYGDPYDIMGGARAASGHYTAFQKERLGWLNYGDSPPLYTLTTSGAYTIEPYETPTSNAKGLKVPQSVNALTGQKSWYYIEYRQAIDNANLKNGVLVHVGTPGSGNTSYLFDMTPETASWTDPALEVGKSFHDPDAGVTITPASADATGISINVTFDAVACTRGVPTVTMSPSQSQWLAAGTKATFTASITNNDNAGCAPSTFDLEDVVPAGWVGLLANPSLTLGPGATASTTLSVTSPVSALAGFYTVNTRTSSAEPAHSASASATYVVTSPSTPTATASVSVSTDKPTYRRPGSAFIAASVRSNGVAVSGASVTFNITKANGSTTKLSATTDANGRAQVKMNIKRQDAIGTYAVVSKAAVSGVTAQGSTTFQVQ